MSIDNDIDLMRDVYMSREQRAAYERILAAHRATLAEGREDCVVVPKAEFTRALESIQVPKMSPLKQELLKAGAHAVIRAFNQVVADATPPAAPLKGMDAYTMIVPIIPDPDAAPTAQRVAAGDVECYVRQMRTANGSEFWVVVRCGSNVLTPRMYAERWKAEYDVAEWKHLLCGAPKPDILAYGPPDDADAPTHPAAQADAREVDDAMVERAQVAWMQSEFVNVPGDSDEFDELVRLLLTAALAAPVAVGGA